MHGVLVIQLLLSLCNSGEVTPRFYPAFFGYGADPMVEPLLRYIYVSDMHGARSEAVIIFVPSTEQPGFTV
jgi:hypothetical protein